MDKIDPTIDLYEAVEEMKKISLAGGTFQFKFRKWNRQTNNGGDLVNIQNARIRPKASDEKIANSSYKLYFVDADTGAAMVCWQPLIMEFNGMRTVLN